MHWAHINGICKHVATSRKEFNLMQHNVASIKAAVAPYINVEVMNFLKVADNLAILCLLAKASRCQTSWDKLELTTNDEHVAYSNIALGV